MESQGRIGGFGAASADCDLGTLGSCQRRGRGDGRPISDAGLGGAASPGELSDHLATIGLIAQSQDGVHATTAT